jgi:predicted ATPase/DNA-binding SARP family transcriptional activator
MAPPPPDRIAQPDGLRIQLLGQFHVAVGSRAIDESAWRRRKAAAIVKLLALAPRHQLHREQLMDLLWPEFEPPAAANNLRRTLHAARRVLDPSAASPSPFLRGDPVNVVEDRPVWVDVEAFEAAAALARRTRDPGHYQQAISLYAGGLLPDDRYEDWAQEPRHELHMTYTALLAELARLHEATGEIRPAIEALERLVACEPAHEDAHVHLMRLLAQSGRRFQALQHYIRLRETLLRELDADPEPATRRVFEQLLERRFGSAGAEPGPPPAPSMERHNLPASLTSFIGREREIGEVTRLLGRVRLVTLVGPGGCGKTRLAIEAAKRLVDAYRDGVWLADLAPLDDAELVPQAVAAVLCVQEQAGVPLTQTLANAVEDKNLLLLLDNCEHLAEACAALADALLRAGPRLHVLATSRHTLNVAGEQVWRVPSLELPDLPGRAPLADVARAEAARLFLDRARLSRASFDLTRANAAAAVEVCRRLDGMPLAIELAAARMRALSVQQVAALLDDRFRLLTSGSRAALPRQQTLRATVDWSYDLLNGEERVLFDRLSVFAGGWTLAAAREICCGPPLRPDHVVNLLGSLVDQSLVMAEKDGEGGTRYRILETLRQYGCERLSDRGGTRVVQERHASHYLALAEKAKPELTGPQQIVWFDRLESEHNNLRMAMRWSLAAQDWEMAARLGLALGWLWTTRGYLAEGTRWLDAVLSARSALTRPVLAKVLTWAGFLRVCQGEYRPARAALDESLCLCSTLGEPNHIPLVLNLLGSVSIEEGDLEQAAAHYRSALATAKIVGNQRLTGLSLYNLGRVALHWGEVEQATAFLEDCVALFREVGDPRRLSYSLLVLARAIGDRVDLDEELALYREGLEIGGAVGARHNIMDGLAGLAGLALAKGRPRCAARLLGAAEAQRDITGVPGFRAVRAALEDTAQAVRACLDEETFSAVFAEGRKLTTSEAIECAKETASLISACARPRLESPASS